ncbi:MAG TPA: hypothetical protein VFN87_16725 [Solirubrobacteraceae bacterium]|nr:hypothetical protein [Solirubrobacteraceae bacterium]
MWKELERRGAVYARILFSVQDGQARVNAVILYDRYSPPWHHELGEVEPDSDLGVALWVAGGGRAIEQGDVVSGDGEMGFTVAERAVNTAWNDHPPPVRRRDIPADGQLFAVLIELPGGEGVVRRVDGELMVTHDVHAAGGLPLCADDRYHPVKTWLPDDRSLVAGILPPGSVRAEVVDDRGKRVVAGVGGGAYAAVLEQPNDGHEPVVCCRDATGTAVRRPLPADYPSTRVDDADVPCPACGAIDYEERVPTESWRGGTPGPNGTVIPSPIVVCRRCGHEEREGTFFAGGGACDDDEDDAAREARIARAREHTRVGRWLSTAMTLRALTFPVYAAEDWPAVIGGSGSHGDRLTSLTIAHHDTSDADPYAGDRPRFQITTSREDSPVSDELRQARWALDGWLHNNDDDARSSWPSASPAAVSLWLAARDRTVRGKVLAAVCSEQPMSIDGTLQPFLTLTAAASGHWVAVRHHGDLMITIAASELDPTRITIEPIPDPAGRLLGPKPPGADVWPE